MTYSTDIVASILTFLNNTGSVGGGSYTQGSLIDPYMQNVLKNRPAGQMMANGSEVRLGNFDPVIQIVTGNVINEPMTPRLRYRPDYTEKMSVELQVILYTKELLFWKDPNDVRHNNEQYTRTYLEYLGKIFKKYSGDHFPTFRIPVMGNISNIEQFPEDTTYWWGFLPIRVSWYNTGSVLF